MLLELRPSGGSAGTSDDPTLSGWPTFDLWLADHVAREKGPRGLRLADVTEDSVMEPRQDGVEILDQRENPDIPEVVEPASLSGVAMLSWHGETWFVLAARYDDARPIVTFAASKADDADDIDAFLGFLRARYDAEAG